ncbi:MAG: FtsQ-type POTRA domain-containing protein, partial [Holosporaceae bacterium]|nr:FtsQ-type POTRA domain-containing protein [Holosporaceae bacterium]
MRILTSLLKNNFFLLVVFISLISGTIYFNIDRIKKAKISHFCIEKIEFDGNEHVPDVLLLKTSGLRYKGNIFNQSLDVVKKKLEHISWIHSVAIRRKLPDTIYITVSERTPIAILQSKHKLYLVDTNGKILENDGIGDFSNLPIVIGKGAEKEASQLLCCLDKFPKIQKQIVFAVRIGGR